MKILFLVFLNLGRLFGLEHREDKIKGVPVIHWIFTVLFTVLYSTLFVLFWNCTKPTTILWSLKWGWLRVLSLWEITFYSLTFIIIARVSLNRSHFFSILNLDLRIPHSNIWEVPNLSKLFDRSNDMWQNHKTFLF